ncbi:MAG: alpha/beta fold hydrolase [Aureispira sp.]|nr:alpha/beta fold hydrolase [Aureispira sp.]
MSIAAAIKNQTWFDQKEYPFQSHYLDIDGQQMHYIDEGEGDVLLFVHGTPSWSFEFRHIIKALSQTHRCIALDHIGMGLSAKPKDYNYTSQQHAQNLEAFIEKKGLKNITLLVHDFGGPIGFDYAIKYPQNVQKLVLFNTWMWSAEGEPEYEKAKKIIASPLVPFLYKYLNFSAKYLIPQAVANKKELSKATHKHYYKILSNKAGRMGTLGFRNSLLQEQGWFQELWEQRAKIANISALIIWGMEDSFIPTTYAERFESIFEQSQLVKLEGVGHFVCEEASTRVLKPLRSFLG